MFGPFPGYETPVFSIDLNSAGYAMKPLTKEDLAPEIWDLFDQYVHNLIERREFFEQLGRYAKGGITTAMIYQFLAPQYLAAQQVKPDDPRLHCTTVNYDSPNGAGAMQGYLCQPADIKDELPGIVVVHENRGLNPHLQDVTRRAALAGYLAFGPDALYPLGGYPGNDDDGRTLQAKRDRQEMLEDFIAAFTYLRTRADCSGQVGVVGFCFGGWVANSMAARIPDLAAAVPFYGGPGPLDQVPQIQAPLLLHFGELDERVNATWPAYEDALKEHGKDYTAHLYPGTYHGFHNDTTPRYDPEAAKLAWKRTLDFFDKHLK